MQISSIIQKNNYTSATNEKENSSSIFQSGLNHSAKSKGASWQEILPKEQYPIQRRENGAAYFNFPSQPDWQRSGHCTYLISNDEERKGLIVRTNNIKTSLQGYLSQFNKKNFSKEYVRDFWRGKKFSVGILHLNSSKETSQRGKKFYIDFFKDHLTLYNKMNLATSIEKAEPSSSPSKKRKIDPHPIIEEIIHGSKNQFTPEKKAKINRCDDENWTLIGKENLPQESGLYQLNIKHEDGTIQRYIGQTNSILRRVEEHSKSFSSRSKSTNLIRSTQEKGVLEVEVKVLASGDFTSDELDFAEQYFISNKKTLSSSGLNMKNVCNHGPLFLVKYQG